MTARRGAGIPLTELKFLTVREIAAVMRVSQATVFRLIGSGEIAAARVGRSYRVAEQELGRYLRSAGTGRGPAAEVTVEPGVRPRHMRAAVVVRGLIADGSLKPGDQMPYAAEIAADTRGRPEHFAGAYEFLLASGELIADGGRRRRLRVAEARQR